MIRVSSFMLLQFCFFGNRSCSLYLDDEKDRYFHIYHSTGKEHGEKEILEEMLDRLGKGLRAQYGTDYQLSDAEKYYFDVFYDNKGILTVVKEKEEVINHIWEIRARERIIQS